VVHAWWIPALGAKQDAIPGFLRDTWFRAEQAGTYRGQCTELCGKEHAFMPIVVRVVPQDEYTKWVGERKKIAAGIEAPAPVASAAPSAAAAPADESKPLPLAELVSRGEKIYAANCIACHQATGQGTPAMKAPALAGNKLVTGADREPIDTVLNGRPNTAMQPFKQQLSDAEIAAVLTYVRNSWGNKASEVQPAEVKARRK
jgi:cytochrome c oxidase subunit 2